MKIAVMTLLMSLSLLTSCKDQVDPKPAPVPLVSDIYILYVDSYGYPIYMKNEKSLIEIVSFKKSSKDKDFHPSPNSEIGSLKEIFMYVNVNFDISDVVLSEEDETEYVLKWKTSLSDHINSLKLPYNGPSPWHFTKDFSYNEKSVSCLDGRDFFYSDGKGGYFFDTDKYNAHKYEYFEYENGSFRYKGGMEPMVFLNDGRGFEIYIPIDIESLK